MVAATVSILSRLSPDACNQFFFFSSSFSNRASSNIFSITFLSYNIYEVVQKLSSPIALIPPASSPDPISLALIPYPHTHGPKCRVNLSSRLPQVSKRGITSQSSQSQLTALPKGKRIALPTRVEPKVFFANERTFLSWLNFTVILGGLAVGLLNFGDRIGRISAGLFTIIAMAAMIYALCTFHWRAASIRKRGQSGIDDRFGPTVLALALLAAVVVNFILRMTEN